MFLHVPQSTIDHLKGRLRDEVSKTPINGPAYKMRREAAVAPLPGILFV